MAQSSSDRDSVFKKITLVLPDGKILPAEKLDSLEQAWGKYRIMFVHNEQDDAKGIMRLIRITDEMKQQQDARSENNLRALQAMLNKPAPDFELTDLKGTRWSLKELRGKIVVLNFWFVACPPCIKEMPELNKLVKSYAGKEIVFLALTFDNSDKVNTFLKNHVFDYTLLPLSSAIDEQYHISAWPTSMVIDQKGEMKFFIYSSPAIREKLGVVIDSLM